MNYEMINGRLSRQNDLSLRKINSVAVIGIGGVGSWVASMLALSGIKNLALIDADVVEETNLGRTHYTLLDAVSRTPKVDALAKYILERRNTNVIPIQKRFEDVKIEFFQDYEIVVDTRDTSSPLPKELQEKSRITGGYDGMKLSIHINPSGDSVWGSGDGYTITPSWLVPPVMIATIIVTYLMATRLRKKEYICNVNLVDLIRNVLGTPKSEETGVVNEPI